MQHTGTVFQHQPNQVLCDDYLVETSNMRMDKLSVMMDLSGKIRVPLIRGLEDYLLPVSFSNMAAPAVMQTLELLMSLWWAR